MISKEVFEKYMALKAEVASLEETLVKHAKMIGLALNGFDLDQVFFGPKEVSFSSRTDDEGHVFPVELLFDPRWEKTVLDMKEKKRVWYKERCAQLIAAEKEATEKRERDQLAKLLEKYPPMKEA